MKTRTFDKTAAGRTATAYLLEGTNGACLEVLDYGGKVVRLCVPDRAGRVENIAMSLDFSKAGFGGSLIGRYANRISHGVFEIDGIAYAVPTNIESDGIPALLHGGPTGFHDKVWQARPFATDEAECLELKLTSPDGEGGFPGNLEVTVVYSFSRTNVWRIEWMAETDRATPVNFTHHVYFNLSGEARRPVSDTLLTIAADGYTSTGAGLIPTGEIVPVEGTDFDFRHATPIGARRGGRYDHNFVLASQDRGLSFAARVEESVSGRALEVWTTEPGMQFYAGGALHDGLKDQFGRSLTPFAGLALETQHYPDSVHHPAFPNTILRSGETFRSVTEFRFNM